MRPKWQKLATRVRIEDEEFEGNRCKNSHSVLYSACASAALELHQACAEVSFIQV
jgi:hypothetical protein